MSIINFTVNYDLFASQTDSSDSGVDADIVALIGTVTFTPLTTDNRPVLAPTYSPRPAGFKLLPFTGYLDIDGRLKSERSGSTGVRLWANDPVLKLNSLNYKVEFDLRTPLGQRVKIDPGYFTAPSTDVSIQLAEVLQSTGTVSTSTLLPQGPKGDRGYSILGLTPALDGTYVQALVESATGPVAVGTPFLPSNSYNSTVTHGTNASYSRPPVSVAVIWIGSVQPNNAIDGDVWMDTSGTAPSITTTVLGSFNQNATTSQTIIASGTTPIIWSLQAGTIPAGLALSTDGNLYGSPTATGSYDFTVKATNPFGTSTKQFTGTIGSAVGPTITTTTLGTVQSGSAFSLTLAASGSTPITYAVQSGSLPTGLTLNTSSGVISGTPTVVGSYTFTIRATNSAGYGDKAFTGSVAGIAPTITTTSLNSMYRAFAFSQTLSVSGSASITYAVQSGALPTGLTLGTSTGVISGTPTTVASYSFTIRATNSYGYADQAFTGSVLQSTPAIVETALQTMTVSTAFAQTLTSTGGPTITWSVQTGTLPTGLSLNSSTGTISGTPTTAGAYSFTIRASNGTSYADQAFTGTVQTLAVVFDTAVSGGGADGSGPLTMSVAPTAGAGGILVVGFTANSTSATISATFDGVAMTQIGSISRVAIYQSYAHIAVFKLASAAPGGTKSIQATCSVGGGRSFGQFVSFSNYSSIGSLQTLADSGARSPGSSVIQNVTTQTGRLVVQGYICSAGFAVSTYSKTLRSPASGYFFYAGTAQAASTTEAFTATFDTHNFAFNAVGVAVDVSP